METYITGAVYLVTLKTRFPFFNKCEPHSLHEWCPVLPGPSPHRTSRNMPRRVRLLADGGYAARVPLIVPRRIAQNRRQRQANQALRTIRMQIEHSIGFQKVYASVDSIFRHKKYFLPFVVCTCGFLSNWRKLIIRRLRNKTIVSKNIANFWFQLFLVSMSTVTLSQHYSFANTESVFELS